MYEFPLAKKRGVLSPAVGSHLLIMAINFRDRAEPMTADARFQAPLFFVDLLLKHRVGPGGRGLLTAGHRTVKSG
jgi:hypothetical protein